MNSVASRYSSWLRSSRSCLLAASFVALAVVFTTGCDGGSISQAPGSNSTSVTVLASSTANDQLSKFFLTLNSITLTSNAGKTVPLLATPLSAEYIHVNGKAEPLTTVSIPQGVYTSATVSVGSASFICEDFDPSSHDVSSSEFGYGQIPSSNVTANLPMPVTVSGTAMGLSLDLLVSQSASWTSCDDEGEPYSITPTFNLAPVNFSTLPTNSANGKVTGLQGVIGSINATGTGFSVTAANVPGWEVTTDGPSWQVTFSSNTVYQGIANASQLVAGMPVDMDATIQADSSLLATRIAVYDTSTDKLSVSSGPLLSVASSEQVLSASDSDAQGHLPGAIGAAPFSFGNAVFQISGQLANRQSLPFAASFTAKNMVAGQNIFISTHALTPGPDPIYIPATTITLLPQTINGTVNAISSSGNFKTYTITLAPYNLFPDLAVQPDQTTLLSNPSSVVVYLDSNTQMLNTNPVAVGSVLRFNGLVFNDGGILRMDCAQVNDGVTESAR